MTTSFRDSYHKSRQVYKTRPLRSYRIEGEGVTKAGKISIGVTSVNVSVDGSKWTPLERTGVEISIV